MQAFRSALSSAQRQGALQRVSSSQRAFSAGAVAVQALSAEDWLQNIKSLADRNIPIKKTKLTSFLKTVTTSEELEASKEIMKIYERKRVDPDASAAGVFVKKALELGAANLVFEVLEANYRIGLFLEPTTLNKLLSKFFKDGEFDKVYQLHEIGTEKYGVKSTDRTYDILIRTAIEQADYDRAVDFMKTAAETSNLMRVTCNNLLFKLKEGEFQDKIEEVATLMKVAGVEPNETTKKILQ
ncbi:hypothetical protein Poli38472_005073 [Pythium oligandrum]|uniref:Uncharacterized protein n=1 Tax=Pythium oligandrum TaxID=41045 RepID=A0A8K1CFW8_PYTOL|nr:hypothetical protein Poli38472_005073 [Pythium oligandrum]|eukprot:TMW62455.1 hypothetical protein Poli38472_005073 [Pythium oligandrum]